MKTLISKESIDNEIVRLGSLLTTELPENSVVIGNLIGAVYFFSDLTKTISKNIYIDFIGINSYEGTKQLNLLLTRDISSSTRNKIWGNTVLLVDDILDSGKTIKSIIHQIETYKPKQIKTCFLLDKGLSDITPDYCAFKIGPEFVVGYGLDYNDKYRNLPYIANLEEEDK